MKLLTLSISLLLLSGCGLIKSSFSIPSFQAGDCMALDSDVKRFNNDPKERWETEQKHLSMELVVEVGEKKYLTVQDYGYGRMIQGDSRISYDHIMTKVECSDRLKEVSKELLK